MKAKCILGCICKSIASRDKDVIIPFYSELVRPHLKYCVHFWSLQFKKDVDRPGRGLRRALMMKGLENLPSEEQLKM